MISTPSSSMADGKPFIGTYVHETPLNSSITVHFTVNPPPVTDITEEARPRVIGPQYVETQRPKVVIVGGSIGGLALGVLLQKAGVEFRILERSTVFDHAETAIFLNSTTHKFLLQIGAWEEISQYAKPTQTIVVANEDRKVEYTLEFRDQVKLFGSNGYIIPRRILHHILVSRIDKENIVMGKRVLSYIPGNRYVIVKCATGDHITCDILVGADGVFSAVRQNLYAELATKGALPSEDSEEVALSTVSLVGQTIPLDSSFYPGLNDEHCQFVHVIGKNKPYTWAYFSTKHNSIHWTVTKYEDSDNSFANNTFGPSDAITMAREVMHFPIFTGGPGQPTIKDFLDKTTDNLRKVVLEEKLFKTWHHGRVVLLGNACHKMNPTRGTGATNAIHDAITLANYIVSLPHWCEQKDIEHRLKAYQEERMPWIKESFESSNVFKIMAEKGFKASMIRLGSKALSGVVARTAMMKMSNNRPQVAFLKYIPDSGSVPSPYQPSYHFTINVLEDRAISDAEDEIRHREAKEAAIQRRDDISKQRTSIIHTSADPNSDTKAAIAHAAIVAEALSAANAAAYAAVTPKNALETFQTMSSKVKKPAVVLV